MKTIIFSFFIIIYRYEMSQYESEGENLYLKFYDKNCIALFYYSIMNDYSRILVLR